MANRRRAASSRRLKGNRRGSVRPDRGNQEGEPLERAYTGGFRPGRSRQGLSGGRRFLPLRSNRRALVSGRARPSDEGAKATTLPILRKDFLFDAYQVLEARAWGADCILIIMAAVDDELAKTLNKTAHDLGLDVLIETHDENELKRALTLEGRLIGVNNRDLRTFETSLEVCERLLPSIPQGKSWSPKAASPITPTASGWRRPASRPSWSARR